MFPVRFLRTEYLNLDLDNFLAKLNYEEHKISFILNAAKIRPEEEVKHRSNYNWQEYYTSELKTFVRQRENLIFSIFPEYDQ